MNRAKEAEKAIMKESEEINSESVKGYDFNSLSIPSKNNLNITVFYLDTFFQDLNYLDKI